MWRRRVEDEILIRLGRYTAGRKRRGTDLRKGKRAPAQSWRVSSYAELISEATARVDLTLSKVRRTQLCVHLGWADA